MGRLEEGGRSINVPGLLMDELRKDLAETIERKVEGSGRMSGSDIAEVLTDTLAEMITQHKDIPGYKILQALKQMIWSNPILSRIMFFSNIVAGVYLTYILFKGLRGFVFYGIRSFRKYKKEAVKKYNSFQIRWGGQISKWFSGLWSREPIPREMYMEAIEEGRSNLRVTDSPLDQIEDESVERPSSIESEDEIPPRSLSDIPYVEGFYQDSRLV